MFNYKSGLLAVLLYLNVITTKEYISKRLHEWEIKSGYVGQQETRDSSVVQVIDEAEGDREDGVEDNTELDQCEAKMISEPTEIKSKCDLLGALIDIPIKKPSSSSKFLSLD